MNLDVNITNDDAVQYVVMLYIFEDVYMYLFFLQEMAGLVKMALDRYVHIVDRISGKQNLLLYLV